jgi:putative nucleotidyltransferase with HDIG domain
MERAERIAAMVGDLPSLPHVAAKVMELIHDSSSSAADLEKLIASDQAMTARLLRVANSVFYGVRGQVSTLSRAIVIIGFSTLRSLVLTGVSEGMHTGRRSCFKDKILWEHSLAAALAARTVAQACRYGSAEEAYVGGLLHDIGKVVLDANVPQEYQLVLEKVYNEQQSFIDAEHEVLGFDHTEVGALVARRWNLAPPLVEAVRLHHEPMGAEIDPTLCAIVSLANSLCVKLGIGPERNPDLALESLDAALMLELPAGRLEEIAATVREKVAEQASVFQLA